MSSSPSGNAGAGRATNNGEAGGGSVDVPMSGGGAVTAGGLDHSKKENCQRLDEDTAAEVIELIGLS